MFLIPAKQNPIDDFLDLNDVTLSNYSGKADHVIFINSGATGLESRDFDTEVGSATDVAANTAERHTQNTDTGTTNSTFTVYSGNADKTELNETGIARVGASTNLPLILSPKGNGALQVDSGGDARGQYAVDLQLYRTGSDQVASGNYSFIAGGSRNEASGNFSHAEGVVTTASGTASHAEGEGTTAGGDASHAEGRETYAIGNYSHAEGSDTRADGNYSHVGGFSQNDGDNDHTFMYGSSVKTASIGNTAYFWLDNGIRIKPVSSAPASPEDGTFYFDSTDDCMKIFHTSVFNCLLDESMYNVANGVPQLNSSGEIEGPIIARNTTGSDVPVDGELVYDDDGFARIGDGTTINGIRIGALIINSNGSIQADAGGDARGANAVDLQKARGLSTQVASGVGSFIAGGAENTSSGDDSFTAGVGNEASGEASHAVGTYTTAGGSYSHAEGDNATASGDVSHAEGWSTEASGYASHAEGGGAKASGNYSHAEGWTTEANGSRSHAEGWATEAGGSASHAEGFDTTAGGDYSHVGGSSQNDGGNDTTFMYGSSAKTASIGNTAYFWLDNGIRIKPTASNPSTPEDGTFGYNSTDNKFVFYENGSFVSYLTTGSDIQLDDNISILLGTGSDSSIYYDGTNLIIDPKEIGSGYVDVLGDVEAENFRDISLTENAAIIADASGNMQSSSVLLTDSVDGMPLKLPVLTTLPASPEISEYGLYKPANAKLHARRYNISSEWEEVQSGYQYELSIETQGDTGSPSRIHIQLKNMGFENVEETDYIRLRVCDSAGYSNATNATIAAAGSSTKVEDITATKDIVLESDSNGLFEVDMTNATAETVTLRIGAAPFGSRVADYSTTLDVTHAAP